MRIIIVFISMAVPFVLCASAFGQRLTEAEVNRITNNYTRSIPERVTGPELRAIKEQVRQTGSPYGWDGYYPPAKTVAAPPQTPATVEVGPVIVTPISGGSSVEPVVTAASSSPAGVTVSPVGVASSDVSVTSAETESESANADIPCIANPTAPTAGFVQAPMKRVLIKEIFAALQFQIERIRDAVSETDVSAETLTAHLKEKGATPEQLTELLMAIEEGETSSVSRIWIILGGDPVMGSKISRTIELIVLLDEMESAVEEQGFSSADIRSFKRAFDKSKPSKTAESTVKGCLSAMEALVAALPLCLNRSEDESEYEIYIPENDVIILLYSKWPKGVIQALDAGTFVVGIHGMENALKDEDAPDILKVVEGSLGDYIDALPTSESKPVVSDTAIARFTLRNTGSDALDFTLGKEKKTLAAGATESYAFPDSGKIGFSVKKTRTVTSGAGWRQTTQQQSYQEKTELPILRGVTYDCAITSGTPALSPLAVEITLDNQFNPRPFHLVVDNAVVVVAPGETQVIGAAGVVTVRFARSADPNDVAVYEFTRTSTYVPAIQQADGKWSLFAAE